MSGSFSHWTVGRSDGVGEGVNNRWQYLVFVGSSIWVILCIVMYISDRIYFYPGGIFSTVKDHVI